MKLAACAALLVMTDSCGVDREACPKVDRPPAPATRIFHQGESCPNRSLSLLFDARQGPVRYGHLLDTGKQITISPLVTGQEHLGTTGSLMFCEGPGTGQPRLQLRLPDTQGEDAPLVLIRFRDPQKSAAMVYVEPLPGG